MTFDPARLLAHLQGLSATAGREREKNRERCRQCFIPLLRTALPPSHPPPHPEASSINSRPCDPGSPASFHQRKGKERNIPGLGPHFFLFYNRGKKAERILGSLGFTSQDVSVLDCCWQCLFKGYMMRPGGEAGAWIRGVSFYTLVTVFAHIIRVSSDVSLCHLVVQKCRNVNTTTSELFTFSKKLLKQICFLTPSFPSSAATSILKKAKRPRRGNVSFDQVTVFFFPRCQGFTSVPSRGGCTLGMMQRHSALRTYTLAEFAVEQRLLRREKLLNRLREEKLEALKLKVIYIQG